MVPHVGQQFRFFVMYCFVVLRHSLLSSLLVCRNRANSSGGDDHFAGCLSNKDPKTPRLENKESNPKP